MTPVAEDPRVDPAARHGEVHGRVADVRVGPGALHFAPKQPCDTCNLYLAARSDVISLEVAGRSSSLLAAALLFSAFMRGVHTRHLAGLSLDWRATA